MSFATAVLLLALAPAVTADPLATPRAPLTLRTESLVGYLLKQGSSTPYGGLRMTLEYSVDQRFILAGRLEAAKQQDGGAADIQLNDPSTFSSLEGEVALAARVSKTLPLYAVGAAGTTVPYDKGKAVVLNAYPKTLLLGTWLRLAPAASVILGGGVYEPAGSGFAAIASLQIPLKERTSLLVDAAVAKTTVIRVNIGVCMFSCS